MCRPKCREIGALDIPMQHAVHVHVRRSALRGDFGDDRRRGMHPPSTFELLGLMANFTGDVLPPDLETR